MVAAVSLAAIDSDIECCSSRWTIVGTGVIAVMAKGDALITCGLSTQLTQFHQLRATGWAVPWPLGEAASTNFITHHWPVQPTRVDDCATPSVAILI